jgi:hypothetical protein
MLGYGYVRYCSAVKSPIPLLATYMTCAPGSRQRRIPGMKNWPGIAVPSTHWIRSTYRNSPCHHVNGEAVVRTCAICETVYVNNVELELKRKRIKWMLCLND